MTRLVIELFTWPVLIYVSKLAVDFFIKKFEKNVTE